MIFNFLKRKPKVFAISDLHFSTVVEKPMDVFGGTWLNYEEEIEKNWKKQVGKNDIVLIAGDMSWGMKLQEALPDLEKIAKWKGKKVMIKGNHEYWWQSISAVREALPEGMFAIQNDSISVGNYIFCGTRGWTVPERKRLQRPEDEKIYKREIERMKLALEHMQKNRKAGQKAVVMIHYPPTNSMLDDSDFTKLFEMYKVDSVIFGHLHGKNIRKIEKFTKNGIKYFLTSCDQVNNKLVRIY